MADISTTSLIKERIDVVEFLRGYLTLTPAGKNFKALCPFHKEKSPSFSISPERQTWHCFGCSLGGDIFEFLMRHENLEFAEALKVLAEKAGIELKRTNPGEYEFAGLLYDINEAAKVFFQEQLKIAPVPKEYILGRGLSQATIEEFEVGWVQNQADSLLVHLIKAGFGRDDIMRAGLAFKTERGSYIDRFRGRIMFPIHNHLGKVVAFTGRILPQFDTGEMGKYVNSPETPIFNKSRLLYGFWKAKNAIREENFAFLVEGQMDMLMSYQAGLKNAVATSGTALTADHLRAIKRLTDRLVLSFDSDEAGLAAGERAIDLAETNDFNVQVLVLKDVKDPAEAVKSNPEAFVGAVKTAKPAPEFYIERYLLKSGSNPKDRDYIRRVRVVLQKFKQMTSAIEQDYWIKELSRRLDIPENVLREEYSKIEVVKLQGSSSKEVAQEENIEEPLTRLELLSQKLLGAALAKNDFSILGERAYLAKKYQGLAVILEKGEQKSSDPIIDEALNLISLQAEPVSDEEIKILKDHLYREHIMERRRDLVTRVRRAEMQGDVTETEVLLKELHQLPIV